MAVGIGRDDSGESQKNQSDLEFKIISYTFPFSFNIFVKNLMLFLLPSLYCELVDCGAKLCWNDFQPLVGSLLYQQRCQCFVSKVVC